MHFITTKNTNNRTYIHNLSFEDYILKIIHKNIIYNLI